MTHSKIAAAYASQADTFASFAGDSFCWRHMEGPPYEEVLREFRGSESARVLDTGCGSGRIVKLLLENNIGPERIIGVDYCERMLALARQQHAKVQFLRQDITELNLPRRTFQLITSHMVFQHLDNHGLRNALEGMYAHLTADGVLFFVATHPLRMLENPTAYGERQWVSVQTRWNSAMHDFMRPVSDYINYVAQAGFRIENVEEIGVPIEAKEESQEQHAHYARFGTGSRIAVKARK